MSLGTCSMGLDIWYMIYMFFCFHCGYVGDDTNDVPSACVPTTGFVVPPAVFFCGPVLPQKVWKHLPWPMHALFTRSHLSRWRWLKILTVQSDMSQTRFVLGTFNRWLARIPETLPHSFWGCQTVFHLPWCWWLYFKESCSLSQRQAWGKICLWQHRVSLAN